VSRPLCLLPAASSYSCCVRLRARLTGSRPIRRNETTQKHTLCRDVDPLQRFRPSQPHKATDATRQPAYPCGNRARRQPRRSVSRPHAHMGSAATGDGRGRSYKLSGPYTLIYSRCIELSIVFFPQHKVIPVELRVLFPSLLSDLGRSVGLAYQFYSGIWISGHFSPCLPRIPLIARSEALRTFTHACAG
jgi:hypothetical protein